MDDETRIQRDMDRMYRWTRHIYDASRKYYLLGRDHLIKNLDAKPGDVIYEIGCGTARNLIKLARTYPGAEFYGIDASEKMLKTAQRKLQSEGLDTRIDLKQGLAGSFKPDKPPDKIIFSYALSIIPDWQGALEHALEILPPGAEIHIVDFGAQENLPRPLSRLIFWWLSLFHVYHKPEIVDYLGRLSSGRKGMLHYSKLYKGYAYYAVFRKH